MYIVFLFAYKRVGGIMLILALALIPVIGLLIFIYVKDKTEKEPMGLLIGLFFAGMGTSITAMILESIGEWLLNLFLSGVPILNAFLLAILVVGPAEEMGKYTVLRLITWKNRNFDYSFDAIVYAVFTSLGFAAIENVLYVFSSGWGTAILRMFTAVPGHACFAVFMGFFYSKAKYASITGKKEEYKKYNALSMLVPILIHGIYDGVIFAGTATENFLTMGFSFLLWIVFVIAMFVVSFIMVHKSSKNDFCIVFLSGGMQTLYMPVMAGEWVCGCGTRNLHNFCSNCGNQRPMQTAWYCPNCGTMSVFNFCGRCGCPKPVQPVMMPQPQYAQQPMPQPQYQTQPGQPQMAPAYQQPYQQAAQPMPQQPVYQQPQYAQPVMQQSQFIQQPVMQAAPQQMAQPQPSYQPMQQTTAQPQPAIQMPEAPQMPPPINVQPAGQPQTALQNQQDMTGSGM
jgi:RsiW-degrading membrane proteinase PrsW (M82 family)